MRQAQANGHKVFLCTGRNYKMTSPVLRYGFDGYVCSAGGYVVCGDTVLFDCPMDKAQSDGVRAVLEASGVECTLEARDATYGGGQMMERLASYQAQRPDAVNSELGALASGFCGRNADPPAGGIQGGADLQDLLHSPGPGLPGPGQGRL